MAGTAIEMIIDPRHRPVGNGVVQRILPFRKRRMVGPFIFADLIGPDHLAPGTGVDIDAHPHLGLSTLTYLFAGSLLHRDSTGAVREIHPGDVNWMTAGAGVCHTERSPAADRATARVQSGLQTWVALPVEYEQRGPFFEHAARDDIPLLRLGRASIAVAAGRGWATDAPIRGSSPLLEAEIHLDDATLRIPGEYPERGLVNVAGAMTVAGQQLAVGQLAVLSPGEQVELHGTGRAMLLAGDPVGDRWIWWNFVASDRELIEQGKRDWDAQRFPLIPADHDVWVPAPAR